MADPLSMCASIIALLQLSAAVATVTCDYLGKAKDAQKDITRIRGELSNLDTVLLTLQALLEDESGTAKSRLPTLELLGRNNALGECKTILTKLIKRLEEPVKTWRKLQKQLMWPLKEKDVTEILDALDRHKATINFALNVDQT